MTDMETPEQPVDGANLTRAGVTGKVPTVARRSRRSSGKRVKLSGSRKRHVNDLKKHAQISPSVASRHGL